ncbi:MAG TPA: AAA family ATPase [Stellaceae bacterium]
MLKILVANAKGGCGKTTIATQLAAALAAEGGGTLLADADRQRSGLGWLARRPASAAPIVGLDWSRDLGKPDKRMRHLVIDAAPALRRKRIAELVGLADLVVVPVLPSAFDEAGAQRFLRRLGALRSVANGRKPVAVVGNRVRSGTRAAAHLDKFFGGLGYPLVARLRDSRLYAETAAKGSSLFDTTGRRERALQADWRPLLDLVANVADDRPQPKATVTTS